MAGPVSIPEESPVLPDCPEAFPEALQMIHPMTADSWKNFIEQIGKAIAVLSHHVLGISG